MFTALFFSEALASPELLVTSRKLDVALRDTTARHQVDALHDHSRLSTRILLLHKSESDIRAASTSGDLWPCLLSDTIQESRRGVEWASWKSDVLPRVMSLIRTNMTLQHSHLLSGSLLVEREANEQTFVKWLDATTTSDTLMRNLVFLESKFGELVEKKSALEHKLRAFKFRNDNTAIKKHTAWKIPEIGLEAWWNKETVMICYRGHTWLLPGSYVLLLHNKVCDCLSSLLLLKAASRVCYERSAYDLAIDLLVELTNLASHHTSYFEIAKSIEGLVVAEVLAAEEDWTNVTLRASIARELSDAGFDYVGSTLENHLKQASSPLKHELAGLIKIPGHPLIDIAMTAEKAEERATVKVDVNYHAIQMTRNLALEQLIRNHIVKHGVWPPVTFDEFTPRILVEAHRVGKDPSSPGLVRKYGRPSAEMYVHVTLGKFLELDRLEHYSQYLKDKALSVFKPDAMSYYITKELDRLDWKETRLLLVHLLHHEDELALPEYFRDYVSCGDDLEDILNYLVVKLVPKEKELKVNARPFGCKTYRDRFRGCLQEENVKALLDQYYEDQAMTLDNLSLVKRLYSFRHLSRLYKGWRVLYINFDVSGWCGNFRHETVEPICSDILDAAYGTRNFFRKTQLAYERGFFYIPDSCGTYHWEGQAGGIEGLNQYTWMLTYIPQMRYALKEFGLHFFVMAYGDDYKAALLIPPTQQQINMAVFKQRVVDVVANTARMEFGQKMKNFDSYGSEVYISFCKQASIRGVEMPQGVRKIQKCYGATNAFLPTLDDYLSSAYSNAHSAAKTMPCTYPAYVVALFWAYLHLVVHDVWDKASDNELHCALLTPSCVGGLPVLFLANFHTRAENDHLPMFLDLVKHVLMINRDLGELLTHSLTFDIAEDSFETLLRDPYSLPIRKPPLPSGILRREVIPALQPIIRNTEIRMLIEAASDDWSDQIVRCLRTATSYPARVFSSIFSCTPKALVEEIVKRFETSASIRDILVMRRGPGQTLRILRRVLKGEIELQTWRVRRFRNRINLGEYWRSFTCSTDAADRLRRLWGKDVTGVTMPALPHLLTITHEHIAVHDEYSRRNHFTYRLLPHQAAVSHSPSEHWELGDQKPFLGHRTKLGSELPQAKIIDTNPFLSKIKTLLDIVSWINIGEVQPDGSILESNLEELIFALLSQYYRGDPRELIPFGAKRKSGTIQHHWRSPHYSEHIMPNTLYNTYTWVTGESNTHEMLRGTVHHHTLNFLQVYCHAVHILQIGLEFAPRLPPGDNSSYWVITNNCPHCMRPIHEPPITISSDRVPKSRQTTLEGLEITSFSRQALLAATDTLGDKRPRHIRDSVVPTEAAVNGLIQSLAEQTTARAVRLCNRMDAPMRAPGEIEEMSQWVPGGWKDLVREREIRHCPIEELTEAVLVQIYHMTFRLGTKASVRRQLQRVWTGNPRDMPWTGMVDRLHQAGRLIDILMVSQRKSGLIPPLCYDNPLTASRYLGQVALRMGLEGALPLSFTWLTYYETDELDAVLERFHKHAVYTSVWTRLKPELLAALRARVRDSRVISDLIASIYVVACSAHLDHQVVERGLTELDTPSISLSLTEVGYLTEDVYEDCLQDTTHILWEVVELLNELTVSLAMKHPVDYDFLAEYQDDVPPILEHYILPYTNLSIHQSSLVDCITYIRALPDPRPIEYKHGIPTHEARDLPVITVYDRPAIGFITRGRDPPITDIIPVGKLLADVFPTQELMLSPHSLSRPYGQATASLNKLLEVFHYLGIDPRCLTRVNVMCLAEGYGGILDMIARMGRECHFLYNTLPPQVGAYTTPGIALDALRRGGHTWDEQLVNTSVFDLALAGTAAAIITNDSLNYALVTCDAEADWADGARYSRLLRHVVHIYLKKRTLHGVLVCKVMLEYQQAIAACLSLLSAHCSDVGIIRCTASPPGGEMYMIAFGMRRTYDLSPDDGVNIDPTVHRLLSTTTQRLQDHWRGICPPLDYSFRIALPVHFRTLQLCKNLLPFSAIHRITGRHMIPMRLTDADQVTQRSMVSAIIREIRLVRRATTDDYWNHENTAAGVVHLAGRIILLTGLERYFDKVFRKADHVFEHGEVRNAYLETASQLQPRILLPDPPVCFLPRIELHGVTFSPFNMWLESIDITLAYWCELQINGDNP